MLSVEDGLPSRLIFDDIQDKDGFMWFATDNGLCRYDGHSFKIYNTQNSPLLSNTISAIAVDANNHLFILSIINYGSSSNANKLDVLDLNSYQFIKPNQLLPNMPFRDDQINLMTHDEPGSIFLLTDQRSKLWQYGKKSTFKLRKDFQQATKSMLSPILNTAKIISANDCILINNFGSNQFYCIFSDTTILIDDASIHPLSITAKKQFVLFDEIAKAMFVMDSSGKKDKIVITTIVEKENLVPVYFYGQTQLFKSFQNSYYLFADNQWIEIYKSARQKMGLDFAVCNYCKDRVGNYWFCTEKGVYQINIRQNQFEHVFSNSQINPFINTAVRSIYVEHNQPGDKKIFAMVNFGLMLKDKEEKSFKNISGTNILKKNDLLYIAGNPLSICDPATGKLKKTIHYSDIKDIWSLSDFSDSLFLIGGGSNIVKNNIRTGKIDVISYALKNIPQPQNVYRFIKTKAKGCIAVAGNGIYFINNQCVVYDYYGKEQQQADKRLPFTGIYDFYEDHEGIAWLAMNGEGLIRWNWNKPHPMAAENFKKFTVENGLPDNILYRIEEDNNNNLWISSYGGLVRFNTKNYSTKIYRTKDGLANAEFNRISSFKDAQGWMYFGGQNGIDVFNPAKLNVNTKENIVSFQLIGLSKFSSANDTIVDISKELREQKEIVMNVGDKFLSVSYSLLDYQNRPHRYAYRIDGMDNDWNYLNEEVIRISGLPYGKLKLHIKAQLESGNWNTQEILIPVTVLKPFYLKTWFYVSMFIILVFIFMLIYLLRVNKLEKDKSILESLVQKRTNSLSEALEEREMLLKEIHHRVKNNLQVITGLLQLQKEELKDQHVIDAFNEGQSRVSSIALIHQNLYQNKDLGNIEFKSFLRDLFGQVSELYENENRKIALTLNLDESYIDIDTAVPLGLIVNELLTNSYKYAFANQKNAIVDISLVEKEKGKYIMTYHDNGPGIKEVQDFNHAKTLGINLIGGLAKQLSGKAEYVFEKGSKFIIQFKDSSIRKMEN